MKKQYKILCFIISILIIFTSIALTNTAFAEENSSIEKNSGAEEDSGDEENENKGLIEAIKTAIDNIIELYESIQLLFEEGLVGIINKTVSQHLNDALSSVAGVFGKVYLVTPGIGRIKFVKKAWSVLVIMSIALIGLSLITTAYKVGKGYGDSQKGRKAAKSVGIAIAFVLISLYLVDLGIWAQNWFWTTVLKESLPTILSDHYKNLYEIPGDMVLKIAFGNYTMSLDDLMTLEITEVFLNPQNGSAGGLLGLIFSMTLLFLSGIIGYLRYIVLCGLGIVSPAYLTGGALMGDDRPAAGLLNILIRTITLQSIFDIGWITMVMLSRLEDAADIIYSIGIAPVVANIFILLIVLIIAILYWVIPMWKAAKSPVTLAGGEVIERFGDITKTLSSASGSVARNMGWVRAESVSVQGKEMGSKLKELGNKIKTGNLNVPFNPISKAPERMNIDDIISSTVLKDNGTQTTKRNHELYVGEVPRENLSSLVASMSKKLPKEAFYYDSEDKTIEIKDKYYDVAIDIIRKHNFIKENKELENINSQIWKSIEVPLTSVKGLKEYIKNNKIINEEDVIFDKTKPNKIFINSSRFDEIVKQIKNFDFVENLGPDNKKEVTSIKEWKELELPNKQALNLVEKQLEGKEGIKDNMYEIDTRNNKYKVYIDPKHENKVMGQIKKAFESVIPYWSKGNKYVIYENGLPTINPYPPENGLYLGKWKKGNR